MLRAEAVAYLVGDGRDVADGPCTAFQRGRGGAAKLCHAVAALVGPADQDAEVVGGGVVAKCLVDNLPAQVEAGLVGGVLAELQAVDIVAEEDELWVAHHLKLDANVVGIKLVESLFELVPPRLHFLDNLLPAFRAGVAAEAFVGVVDKLRQDAGGQTEGVYLAGVLDDRCR